LYTPLEVLHPISDKLKSAVNMLDMKLWPLIFILFTSTVFAQNRSIMLGQNFEEIFPPGVPGNDWFSPMAHAGHKLKLVKDGQDAFNQRLRLIHSAHRSILLSTFIYDVDSSSTEITNALCYKSRQGVDVRILVDSLGSKKFYNQEAEKLRWCGVGVVLFQPGRWDVVKVVKTMHDKLLIVDGRQVYMGGRNIQNSYHDEKPSKKYYHDMDIILEGPVACWWHFKFVEVYDQSMKLNILCRDSKCRQNRARNEYLYGRTNYPACYPLAAGNSNVIPVYGNPIFDNTKTPLEDMYILALENLEDGDTVKLYSPYLVPTPRFVSALVKARNEKNANIQIITNSIDSNDEGVTVLVAMLYSIDGLKTNGIDIRIYPGPNTMHRKVGVFGSKYGYIGSDNLDSRGQHYQTESVIFTDDHDIVKELEEEFDHDYAKTRPLTPEYIKKIRKAPGFFQYIFARRFRRFF
jgi:cardiolipin synthase A/B